MNIYIAPLRDSEAFPTQVSATTSKEDSLQALTKKGKRKGEVLKAQLLRKIVTARGVFKNEASGLSSSTAQLGGQPEGF